MLRLPAALSEIDLFDIHRSQFPLTQRFSALQQSRLLRYTDANTGELEGDLVAEWEIPDETSYVLILRPGVRWWAREPTNGRAFTGEDVRLNIERQVAALDASGAPDARFLRQGAYERVSAVEVADEGTVVLRSARAGRDTVRVGAGGVRGASCRRRRRGRSSATGCGTTR